MEEGLGLIYSKSFMTGQHKGPEPQKDLCLAQSTLVYATIPMNAAAVFSLVLNVSRNHISRSFHPVLTLLE